MTNYKGQRMWRLPNNKYTVSAVRLSREWAKIYKPFCKKTGCKVRGYGPGITFTYGPNCVFSLPVELVQKING